MSQTSMSRLGLAVLVVVSGANVVSAEWQFGTSSFQDDFDSEPFPGWIGASTSPSIDGNALGPATEFELGFMDFIDDLPPVPRILDVSFDLPPAISVIGGPEVSFNGVGRFSEPIAFSLFRYHTQVASSSIPFPGLGDLLISFSYPEAPAGAEFTLDNVVVDWSQPVPEPSSAVLLIALAAVSILPRRGRSVI